MPNPLKKGGHVSPDNFVLPDGRDPEKIRVSQLYAALVALKIPHVSADMGKHLLLQTYHSHVLALIEAMPRARHRPNHLVANDDVRLALEQIAKDAA